MRRRLSHGLNPVPAGTVLDADPTRVQRVLIKKEAGNGEGTVQNGSPEP